jgi:hypothetical protein
MRSSLTARCTAARTRADLPPGLAFIALAFGVFSLAALPGTTPLLQ